jgi:hypothetical protein
MAFPALRVKGDQAGRLVVTFLLCFIVFSATPASARALSLKWNATLSPPHNEPVVGNRVARYRLQVAPHLDTRWLRYKLQANAWGVNRWQLTDVVGSGLEAWSGSDWSVEEWRFSLLHRIEVGPKYLGLFMEGYMPIDRFSWGGHGMERHYYWLIGFGGEI